MYPSGISGLLTFPQSINNLGGSLAPGNDFAHAAITLKISFSFPAVASTDNPIARPLSPPANPNGTLPMGKPAAAAIPAMRESVGPMMAVREYRARREVTALAAVERMVVECWAKASGVSLLWGLAAARIDSCVGCSGS